MLTKTGTSRYEAGVKRDGPRWAGDPMFADRPGRMRLPRRRLLAGAGSLPLARPAHAGPLPSLKDAAASAGLKVGTDSDVEITKAPPAYAELLAQQCNLFAPVLSWSSIESRLTPSHQLWEEPNIGWARRHGMKLTGAHLLWHLRSPDWLASMDDAAARAEVDRHITQLAGRYAGQVYSWNVVNEAIETRRGEPDGIRQDLYASKLGPDWMARAFMTAKAADPGALMLYNDALFENTDTRSSRNRDALLRLLDRLQRAGAPIDGVGTQSHIRLDDTIFDPGVYRRFLRDIASRGLKIVVTELDVFDYRGGPDTAARDADVASRYRMFLNAALDETAVKAVVLWGLSDRYTWITPERGGVFTRPDRLPARPLPFDDQFQPKPAFYAILDAFKAAPQRRPG